MHKKSKIAVAAGFVACTLGLIISCSQNSEPEPTPPTPPGPGPVPTVTYEVDFNVRDYGNTLKLLTPVTKVKSNEDLVLQFTLADGFPEQHYYLPEINDEELEYPSLLKVTTGETTLPYGTGFQYEIEDGVATLVVPHENYEGNIEIDAKAGKVKHTITIVEDLYEEESTKHFGFNQVNPFDPEDIVETTDEYYYSSSEDSYSARIYSNVVDFIGEENPGSMGHISYELPEQIVVYAIKDGKQTLLTPDQYYYHPGAKQIMTGYYADFSISSDLLYDDLVIIADRFEGDVHEIGIVTSSTYIDTGEGLVFDNYGISEFHNDTHTDEFMGIFNYERGEDLDGSFNITDEYSGLYEITGLYVYAKEDPEEESRTLLLPSQYTFIISSAQGWFDYEAQSATIHIDNTITEKYWNFEFELIIGRVENAHKINVTVVDEEGEEIYPEVGGPIVEADPVYIHLGIVAQLYIDMKITNDRYCFLNDTDNIAISIDTEDGQHEMTNSATGGFTYDITDSTYERNQYGTINLLEDDGDGYDVNDLTADGQIYITVKVERLECDITVADTQHLEIDPDSVLKREKFEATLSVKEEYTDRFVIPEDLTIEETRFGQEPIEWMEGLDYTLTEVEGSEGTEVVITSLHRVIGDIEIVTPAERVKCLVTVKNITGATYPGEYELSQDYFDIYEDFDTTVTLTNASDDKIKIVPEAIKNVALIDFWDDAGGYHSSEELTAGGSYLYERVGTAKSKMKFIQNPTGTYLTSWLVDGMIGDIEITLDPQTLKHDFYAYDQQSGIIISNPTTSDYHVDVTITTPASTPLTSTFYEKPGQQMENMIIDIKLSDEAIEEGIYHFEDESTPTLYVQLETLGTTTSDFGTVLGYVVSYRYHESTIHPDWCTGFKISVPNNCYVGDETDTDYARGNIGFSTKFIIED